MTMETATESIPVESVASSTDDGVLVCRDVQKRFTSRHGEISVLSGVNLSVRAGEIVVIAGKSGAGKSTLLGMLAGLEHPSGGSVQFEGCPFESLTNAELARLRREKIGIIFQSFNLIASWTALENVESALLHTSRPKAEQREIAMALLEKLGLASRLHNLPSELSVGQQQRVAVARTLIKQPSLILADEPTGDVDEETAQEILQQLIAPVREGNATLVVTTHGIFPLALADRVLFLKEGRLHALGEMPIHEGKRVSV